MTNVPEAAAPTRIHVPTDRSWNIDRDRVAAPFRIGSRGLQPRIPEADYVVVDRLEHADAVGLPIRWEACDRTQRRRAAELIDLGRRAGLATIVWVGGDHEAEIAEPSVIQFQHAALRHRPGRRPRLRCYPPFFGDPLARDGADPSTASVARRGIGDRPVVGFCGQARQRPGGATHLTAKKLLHRLRRRLGAVDTFPEPLSSHLRLRRRAMAVLARSDRVATDFIVRDSYRAGLQTRAARADPLEPTNVEFTDNILGTDFTLCIRGGGNFSNRLFEAMAVGRIPVLIDTGSLMPYENQLDWRELAVVVGEDELDRLPEVIADRHQQVGPAGVAAWQERCRSTWVDWLSVPGFFKRFGSTL